MKEIIKIALGIHDRPKKNVDFEKWQIRPKMITPNVVAANMDDMKIVYMKGKRL